MISTRYRSIAEEAYEANLGIPKLGLAILTWGNASAADASLGAFAISPRASPTTTSPSIPW